MRTQTVTSKELLTTPARPSSVSAVQAWVRALEASNRLTANADRTLGVVLDELAERHGDALAILSSSLGYSFRTLARRARRYTRWARAHGYGPGDVVALLSPNQPDYFAAWVGISRAGATVALINTNLAERVLAHCLGVCGARALLLAPELRRAYASALPHLPFQPVVWSFEGAGGLDLAAYEDGPLPAQQGAYATLPDRALLIFTSGTTGLPKAANVSHARVLTWCGWFAGMMDAGVSDRLYNCLPMYHSVGGVVAVGGALLNGGSVFVRERFSATAFWPEVVRYECTLFQYIGELCRFLLAQPPQAAERMHRLRLACGNGLREDVWTAFQERFAIPRVLEFYAATEGSFSLYNVEGRPGAIGRVPSFLAHRFPAAIVRYDSVIGEPVRDAEGRCLRCEPGEVGEAIGRIAAPKEGGPNRFEGYTSRVDGDRKILHDVFQAGDAWFRTGDLMRRDEAGFFYFVDRIGDTFRWKGENVSTTEVADVLTACPGVQAAAVYGVEAAHCDGRAGMAAITVGPAFDLEDFGRRVDEALPSYARPVFLRICDDLQTTETFKLKKATLASEGFDPAHVRDAVYVLQAGAYQRLGDAAYARLLAGELRL